MDLKICTKCNCEKPQSEFRVTRIGIDGAKRFRARCKKCEWASRTLEAREAKRERERGKWKNTAYAARYLELKKQPHRVEWSRKYYAERAEKRKAQRFEETLGRHCFFMVRKCEKCGKVDSVKRTRPNGMGANYCVRCCVIIAQTGRDKPKQEVQCIDCNKSFMGSHNSKRCGRCAYIYSRSSYGADHRVKARYYGVPYENVDRALVFKRDKWRCYICNEKIFISRTYHPRQATLDCVIAMANGGGFLYSNVRACCMQCNSIKGDNNLNDVVKHKYNEAMQLSLAL